MNCALTIEQQKAFIRKIAVDLDDAKKFDFKTYAKDIFDAVVGKTKDPVLAANYVSLLPANIWGIMGVYKPIRKKLAGIAGQISDIETQFEDFKNVESYVNQFATNTAEIVQLEKTIQEKSLTQPVPQATNPVTKDITPEQQVSLWDLTFDVDQNNFLKPDMKIYADAKAELIKNVQPDGSSIIGGVPVRAVFMSTDQLAATDMYPDTQRQIEAGEQRVIDAKKNGVALVIVDKLDGAPIYFKNDMTQANKGEGTLILFEVSNPKPGKALNQDDVAVVNQLMKDHKMTQPEAIAVVNRSLSMIRKLRDFIAKDPENARVSVNITGGTSRISAKVSKQPYPVGTINFGTESFAPYSGVTAKGQRGNVYYFNYPGTSFPININRPSVPFDLMNQLAQLLTEDVYIKQGSDTYKVPLGRKLEIFHQFLYTDPKVLDLSADGETLIVKELGQTLNFPTPKELSDYLVDFFTRKITVQRSVGTDFVKGKAKFTMTNRKLATLGSVLQKVNEDQTISFYEMGPFQMSINKTFVNNEYSDFVLEQAGDKLIFKETKRPYNEFIKDNFNIGYETPQPAGSTLNFQIDPGAFVGMVKQESVEKYKGVPLIKGEIVNNKGVRGGAKYNKPTNTITYDPVILKQKFEEKAWTKPQLEGVRALKADQFATYEEWQEFVLEHEYQHSIFPQRKGESVANYENRINDAALRHVSKGIIKTYEAKKGNVEEGLFDENGNLNPAAYYKQPDTKNAGVTNVPIEKKLSPRERLKQAVKNNPGKLNKIIGQKGLEATLEQIDAAEKWYNAHPLSAYFPFEALFDVVNQEDSNTIANWTTLGITLFKGSDFSELYHEAWHGFTQGFLSQDDKVRLYNEARKKSGTFKDYRGNTVKFSNATDLQLEEYLAEDFRSYMLSNGQKVMGQSPARNTIFRRIFNFLKRLFGVSKMTDIIDEQVNATVAELYRKLRVGDLTSWTYSADNRNFYTLNKALQPINDVDKIEKSQSFENSNLLFGTVESLFSEGIDVLNAANIEEIQERRKLQAKNNKTSDEKEKLKELNAQATSSYTTVMLSTAKGLRDLYNYVKDSMEFKLADYMLDYEQTPSTYLDKKIKLLQYALRNFGDVENLHNNKQDEGVIGYHLFKSGLIEKDVFRELDIALQAEEDQQDREEITGRQDEGKTYFDRGGNEQSIFDLASREIINLFKSLNKTDINNNVENNALGFPKLVNYKQAFAYIMRTVQNSKDLVEMYDKLEREAGVYPPIGQLLKKLGPLYYPEQTDREVKLWSKFFQTANKYRINLVQTTVNKSVDEVSVNYDIKIGNALAEVKRIDNDWKQNFRSSKSQALVLTDIEGNYLDFKTLFEKYPTSVDVNNNPLQFLRDIGIGMTELPIIKQELQKDIDSGYIRLEQIYKNLHKLQEIGQIVRGITRYINNNKEFGIVGQTGSNSNYGKLLTLESRYSGAYSDFMVQNAAGDPQSEFTQNNSLTQIAKQINGSTSYNDLVNSPPTEHFNKDKGVPGKPYNPFVGRSVWFKSLYDMSSMGGVRYKGNEIVIDNLSGVNSSVNDQIFEEGVATAQADELTNILNAFHVQLMKYTPELTRHAGKKTSLAVYLKNYKTASRNPRLYVDTENFVTDPNGFNQGLHDFHNILINYLAGELDRVNYCKALLKDKTLKEFDFNYLQRGTKFVAFAGVLSTDTKNLLYKIDGDLLSHLNTQAGIELSDKIYDDIRKYFNGLVDDVQVKMQEAVDQTGAQFISKSLMEKTRADAVKVGKQDITDPKLVRALNSSFVANNWVQHFEEMIVLYGDIALYKDFFKRNASLNSTGDIIRNDQVWINHVNQMLGKPLSKQAGVAPDVLTYSGIWNTAVVADVLTKSVYLEEYKKAVDSPIVDVKYGENGINEPDAQGLMALDSYRIALDSLGKWTNEQERIFQELVKGVPASQIRDVKEIFPVLKMGMFGPIQNSVLPLTGLHKFALMPLIPGLSENLDKLHNKMMQEGVDYLTFESGSKVATITDKTGFQPFYSDLNKRELNEAPFVKNRVFTEYLKYQVEAKPKYKGTMTLPTQLRKLAEIGLMEHGVPTDFKKGEAALNKMNEMDKRGASPNYKMRQRYIKALEHLVEHKKNELLADIGWVRDKQGNLKGDMESMLRLVSDELKRGDIGEHEWEYIQTVQKGEVANSLDVSTSADMIEKVVVALANKRLINIKIRGEQLVMVSTTGFEDRAFAYSKERNFDKPTDEEKQKYGTNDLPTYHIRNGKIAAAKVKIALQGDFKLLLKLEDVRKKAGELGITRLEALNILLKNDSWLDEGEHRAMISMVGARIPTQGPNSSDFVEVYEFLPEIAGNIIIAPSEVTSKGGSDFDYDKLPLMMPNIRLIEGMPELVKKINKEQAKLLHQKTVDKAVEINKLRTSYRTLRWKQDTAVDNLLKDIFGDNWNVEYTEEEIDQILNEEGMESFETFYDRLNGSAVIENELQQSLRDILQRPENFIELIRPNDTDKVKPLADEKYKEAGNDKTKDKEGTRMFEITHNLKVQQANYIVKDALAIGAINGTFNAVFGSAGVVLNSTFANGNRAMILMPHNLVDGRISLSGRQDALNENNIADVISQLINGWVDVEKDDWIAYIQGNKEIAPVMLFMVRAGVPIKDVVKFVTQPLVRAYAKEIRTLRSSFAEVLGKEGGEFAKANARRNILNDPGNKFQLPDTKKKTVYEETVRLTGDKDLDLDDDSYENQQAMFLHFLEITDMAAQVDKVQRAFNVDTTTLQTLTEFNAKIQEIEDLKNNELVPNEVIEKIKKNSPIGPFYVHEFVLDLFGRLLPLRNHKALNNFLNGLGSDDIGDLYDLKDEDQRIKFQHAFKNDLLNYLFQQQVRANKTTSYKTPDNVIVVEVPEEAFVNEDEQTNFIQERERLREMNPFSSINADIEFNELMRENERKDNLKLADESIEDFVQRLEKISYEEWLRDKALYNIFNPYQLFKSKTNVAATYEFILEKYPQLKGVFSILNDIKKSYGEGFTNLMPSTMKLEKDDIDVFHENLKDLSNRNELLKVTGINQRDADYIASFFDKLPLYLYLQSGPNTRSPFSFARIIPQDKITGILEKPVKDLTAKIDDKFLQTFLSRFIIANSNKSTRNRFKEYLNLGEVQQETPTAMQLNMFKEAKQASTSSEPVKQAGKVTYSDKIIIKFDVLKNDRTLYLFGDNDVRQGLGGQAKEMRGELNTIGISTKKLPNNSETSFKTDAEFEENARIITEDINKAIAEWNTGKYDNVIIPPIGVGLANLPEKAPKTYAFLQSEFKRLEDVVNTTPDSEPAPITSISELTNHSGGAIGADIEWDNIGKEFGLVDTKHYWMNNKTPHGNVEITKEDMVEGQKKVTEAARQMGRIDPTHQVRDERLIRNWSQVKYSDAIFAVTTLLNEGDEMNYGKKAKISQGKGGTGYAVQMAINEGKPVYIFDQSRKKWYSNIDGKWSETEVPLLTANFAGIGTREINEAGKQAIRDVFEKTKETIEPVEQPPKQVSDEELDIEMAKCRV